MNAIFHYGSCVEEGHYINMCREGTSWIEIDDVQVIKKQWPRDAKDISILFLQKNITKNIQGVRKVWKRSNISRNTHRIRNLKIYVFNIFKKAIF
ncbi:hypothetical protein ALC57_13250 [Trachymyrmex cornetzi]|uniref:USP domain-containing protein n=1 Tax=Trachymyrmex cornetzi TaxID=471704 RepID=A0A151IZS0_9HYME|nr:hypothetical protein ALC57_13250 [Trachymyrmex cornetzi]